MKPAATPIPALRDVLLTRRGLVSVPPGTSRASETHLQGAELELANLGRVPTTRLRARLATQAPGDLASVVTWMRSTLAAHLGADQKHEPLFLRFPDDVPRDTEALWLRKVVSHFLQRPDQPCPYCRQTGTCHVLRPCWHVVCDKCFDGANYSACPICEHHVDRSSPFFLDLGAAPPTGSTPAATLALVDLVEDFDGEVRALFTSLCTRRQAMSPDDRRALEALVRETGLRTLQWIPTSIPVRENVAIVFGTLFQTCDPQTVLPLARRYLASATDVLRLVAAASGADPALQTETVIKEFDRLQEPARWWSRIARALGGSPPGPQASRQWIPIRVRRFRVAKLRRSVRRALLEILETFDADRLVEDMLRHRSYWVWVGEFLHPHEYADRYPNVARGFLTVRKFAPDGTPAPRIETYGAKVEAALRASDSVALRQLLSARPGELARRFDHALRATRGERSAQMQLVAAFEAAARNFSTPVLLTLWSGFPTRVAPASVRIYWPKGQVAKGVSAPDHRAPLDEALVDRITTIVETELLSRFAGEKAYESALLDRGLRSIVAPFNERTAANSAVALPRGSRIDVPSGKVMRLVLHWCQPAANGHPTDLDLSVAFYDQAWTYLGVCSYYQHQFLSNSGARIAASAGDLRDAPFPDGASEFVDVHVDAARSAGVRYAVMVVNAYAGMPFSLLERAFAGLMFREDVHGPHFDARTLALKFALTGEHGVYLPLVVDIDAGDLHWLDVHAKGQFEMNNVETSKSAIAKLCPELMAYFGSGVRVSMFDLAALHVAARVRRVHLRSKGEPQRLSILERGAAEDARSFLRRLRTEPEATDGTSADLGNAPAFAALLRGDVELPNGSDAYCLFPAQTSGNLAASDLIK